MLSEIDFERQKIALEKANSCYPPGSPEWKAYVEAFHAGVSCAEDSIKKELGKIEEDLEQLSHYQESSRLIRKLRGIALRIGNFIKR